MVSALGLGGAYHYGPDALSDQDTINKMFDRALDLGINYFDTSPDYGTEGHFAHLAKSRERCFIATKVNTMSAEGARSEVLNSLKVMNTDYLDIIQTHYKPTEDDWTGTLAALEELNKLRDEGKIRFVGFTHHSYDILRTVLTKHVDLIDTILLLYSFHPETSGAEEIIDLAHSLDIGIVAMKVFRGASESWEEQVKKWKADEIAWSRLSQRVDENTSVGQACLKYVLKNPKGDYTIAITEIVTPTARKYSYYLLHQGEVIIGLDNSPDRKALQLKYGNSYVFHLNELVPHEH